MSSGKKSNCWNGDGWWLFQVSHCRKENGRWLPTKLRWWTQTLPLAYRIHIFPVFCPLAAPRKGHPRPSFVHFHAFQQKSCQIIDFCSKIIRNSGSATGPCIGRHSIYVHMWICATFFWNPIVLLLKFWALFTLSESKSQSSFCFKLIPIVLMANSGGSRIPQPGTQTAKGVRQSYMLAINLFPENCMKLKKLQ